MEDKEDWCSRWPDLHYGYCCKTHDEDYLTGGDWRDRMNADAKLRRCVRSSFKKKEITGRWSWFKRAWRATKAESMAWTMWSGTRAAGWTPKHWNRISRSWNGGKQGRYEEQEVQHP